MFCHKCGASALPDAQFCPSCGTVLGSGSTALTGQPPVPWTAPLSVEVRAGHWVAEGWRIVKADVSTYMLLTLAFFLVGSLVPFILQGPLIAGLHIYTIRKIIGRNGDFSDLFKGFNFFIPTMLASLVIGLFVGCATLLLIIPGLVVAAMYKFTYLFIVDKRMDFWQAMRASHAIVRQDYVGFTLFLVLIILVDILGFLCLLIGLLVSVPVTFAAITVAYREIVGFDQRTVDALSAEL